MSKPRKRANGSGSIYKRKEKIYKPWQVLVSKQNSDGTKKRICIGNFKTKAEATSFLNQYLDNPTDLFGCTFSQMYEAWSNVVYKNIMKSTQDNYTVCYKKMQKLYKMKMSDIKVPVLQSVIDENSDYSFSTLSKMKALMTQIFDYAMQNDIVNKNYASYVVLPDQVKKEKEVFSLEEVKDIEAAAFFMPYADIVLVMIYTGFRIAELLELTKDNYNENGQFLCGGKKTAAGKNRIVPIHPKIQAIVKRWVNKNGETIFCRPDGTPFTVDNFRRKYYYKVLKDIGVRELSPHATRHTFATMLSQQDVRTEDIQKLIGHSRYSVTAETYIHQSTETLRNSINQLR